MLSREWFLLLIILRVLNYHTLDRQFISDPRLILDFTSIFFYIWFKLCGLTPLALASWLRTITSDRTVHDNSSFSFWTRRCHMISLDGNYWEVINLLFVLPGLYLYTLKTEEILQFWRLTTCAGNWLRTITSDRTVYDNSSLSFWTRRCHMI